MNVVALIDALLQYLFSCLNLSHPFEQWSILMKKVGCLFWLRTFFMKICSSVFQFIFNFVLYFFYIEVKRKNPELLTALIYRYDFCNLMIDGKPRFTGPMHLLVKLIDVVGDLMVHSWLPDFLGIDAVSMHKDHISLYVYIYIYLFFILEWFILWENGM